MNDNLDLTKILKNYFFNNKFYTTIWGEVRLFYIDENSEYPIKIIVNINKSFKYFSLTKEGKYNINDECVFFPSKDQRDWNQYYQYSLFKSNDIVLVRNNDNEKWMLDSFLRLVKYENKIYYICDKSNFYTQCIPYNKETQYLFNKCININ